LGSGEFFDQEEVGGRKAEDSMVSDTNFVNNRLGEKGIGEAAEVARNREVLHRFKHSIQ
jgi:hypothetical protein